MNDVVNLPQKMGEMRSGGTVKAIVPQTMDDAYRLAKAVCMSGLAPKGLDKPEAAMVAIMHGMEVGLTPMMALQNIAVINGRPTIWGDGALGLVRGSGVCRYVKEWSEGEGDKYVAHCETQRNGEPDPIRGSFSVTEAKRAGLWDKGGPWKQFPQRMLQMRARAFALRDGYADVLGGMYLAEELHGTERTMQDITPAPPSPPPPPARPNTSPPEPPKPTPAARGPREPVAPRDPEHRAAFDMQAPHPAEAGHDADTGEVIEHDAETGDSMLDYADRIEDWADRLKAASDDEQGEIWETEIAPLDEAGRLFPPDRDRLKRLLRTAA